MSSEVTVTEERGEHSDSLSMKVIKFDWLSHTDGVVTGVASTYRYDGQIVRVVFVPDGSTTAPDDQYDVTLTDGDSIDVLYGQGANLSGTYTVVVTNNLGYLSDSQLTCAVTGAGSANGGIVYVYIR